MPTLTGTYIIERATDTLQDKDNIRWPRPELLAYINDGQREIALQRPDSTARTEALELAANTTLQQLPPDGIRLIEVTRNLTGIEAAPGRVIKLTAREVLDQQTPNWHQTPAVTEVRHYIFDIRNPKKFYVYPRPGAGVSVEIVYSATPADLLLESSVISLDDIYANAIIAYVIMRAYQKDEDYARNADAAAAFYAMMSQSMGARTQADAGLSPNANLGVDKSR